MKKSDLTEFAVEEENFKLQIKRASHSDAQPQLISYAPTPAAPSAPAAAPAAIPAAAPEEPAAESGDSFITSPMVGTFYAASSPESAPFVKPGDTVEPDSVVCIIEAMKIMNEIQSERKGAIAEVLVENGQPVEFGQKLFRLA